MNDASLTDGERERFFETVGLSDEPLAMFYADEPPAGDLAPSPCDLPTVADERQGSVNWGAIWQGWSCVFQKLWLARKKRQAAWFSVERWGCLGGAFYLGFMPEQLDFVAHYVSTGIPGAVEGERYLDSPQAARNFFAAVAPRPAPKPYCVFKPVSLLAGNEKPEIVVFFARPEVMSGLHQLAVFVTGDLEAVMSPFGAGCTNIVSWPLKYRLEGRLKAVLGGWDPSQRKFLKGDELTLAVSFELYERFLARWEESFLKEKQWGEVRKKIERSRKAWGEE